ncbi:hypothetical protein L2Y96_16150 [Luteibacter aegosomaticola]|uniref:hypothetical protein n=1 Tax=Luteibacter aegosomaticola TaxID=2911538 RepID=UPI001FF84C44|nr:hypothetical protein [Luteibacter aegosomaticola]UPG88920.1 hypothetical protein L2Y96_16150 [Luteibacter aegosomaticola]
MSRRIGVFAITTVALWLLAHAVAFLTHEFAHSFLATALGWKGNPLDLDWGHATPMNILLLQDVDENVDYAPVFAGGHAVHAGLIALAGVAFGNLVASLGVGLALLAAARKRAAPLLGYFAYWLIVMSVGNLISYVPLRTFASHADMHTVALGFGWTPMEILLLVGMPFFAVVAWFFIRCQPCALAWLFPDSTPRRNGVVVLTSLTVFGFFCMGGLTGYGETSRQLCEAFMFVLGPLSLVSGLLLTRRAG